MFATFDKPAAKLRTSTAGRRGSQACRHALGRKGLPGYLKISLYDAFRRNGGWDCSHWNRKPIQGELIMTKQKSDLKFRLVVEQDGKDVHSEELGFMVLRKLELGNRWYSNVSNELIELLAHHPDPAISGNVAGNDKISDASLELLAQSQQRHIRSELIDNDKFSDWASTELLLEYVRADAEIAEKIASRLGAFNSANTNAVANVLLKHPSPAVRYNMADDWSDIPKKLLRALQNDPDASVRAMAAHKLKEK